MESLLGGLAVLAAMLALSLAPAACGSSVRIRPNANDHSDANDSNPVVQPEPEGLSSLVFGASVDGMHGTVEPGIQPLELEIRYIR